MLLHLFRLFDASTMFHYQSIPKILQKINPQLEPSFKPNDRHNDASHCITGFMDVITLSPEAAGFCISQNESTSHLYRLWKISLFQPYVLEKIAATNN